MRREHLLLGGIMLFVLLVRIFFVFQAHTLTSDGAYFVLRQVEHVVQHGTPITEDPLSYGGRAYFLPPLWYYITALPGLLFSPIFGLKILPNLFFVLLLPFCFRLTRRFTQSNGAALAATTIAAWVPATFRTMNDASSTGFALFLFFVALDGFMDRAKVRFLTAMILLALTHSIVVVLALSLLLYALLARTEQKGLGKGEQELILFAVLFTLWIQVLFYKQELAAFGTGVIWGSIPRQVLANYFSGITILQAIGAIGYLPFLYGVYATLNTVFGGKEGKGALLLLSILLVTTLTLWLRVIPLNFGLPLLGLALSISFGHFLEIFGGYLRHFELQWMRYTSLVLFAVLMVFTSLLPAVLTAQAHIEQALPPYQLRALEWLKENSNPQETVLAQIEEGNVIAALAERPTIADTQFRFAPQAEERYADLRRVFQTPIRGEALQILHKYNVSLLYLSPLTRETYGGGLAFEDANCFDLEYNAEVRIYEVRC